MVLDRRRAAASGKRVKRLDAHGLYLVTKPSGAQHWEMRYQIRHQSRAMGLGSTYLVDIARARDLAKQYHEMLHRGIDPLTARRNADSAKQIESMTALTFAECAKQCHASQKSKWRNPKAAAQWLTSLERH